MAVNDGNDYVPTPRWVAFSHYFASVAGAGPIVGPVAAMAFGYLPAWLWIVLGGVFFGAVHDYTALFVSLRERGKTLAEVSQRTLGRLGFLLFILFTIGLVVLVTSAFLGLTATALTSMLPAAKVGVEPGRTIPHTLDRNGTLMVQIGGIASTSVIVMTLLSPLIGYLLYRRGVGTGPVALLALGACVLGILAGLAAPVTLPLRSGCSS